MNPRGIVFGADGKVDVTGAFTATTADYIELEDGKTRFYASLEHGDPVLNGSPPKVFGFLESPSEAKPGKITLSGTKNLASDGKGDALPNRQLQFVGGDVLFEDGAKIVTPSGSVAIVSVGSGARVGMDFDKIDRSTLADAASIKLKASSEGEPSEVDVSGEGDGTSQSGGRIVIRGGELHLEGGMLVSNSTGDGVGQGIDIEVFNDVLIRRFSQDDPDSNEEIQIASAIDSITANKSFRDGR